MEKMVKEIEELRLKESAAVEEQKKLSRSVRYQIMMILIKMTMTMITMTATMTMTMMATMLSTGSTMDLRRTDHSWSLHTVIFNVII